MIKKFIIEKLGGYVSIETAIDAIREEDTKTKYRILSLAVKKLYNTISEDDILKENEYKQWTIAGKPINQGEKNLLIAEAKQFLNTKLWKVLQKDIQYQANRKMFILGKSEIDMIAGKLFLYTLDCIKTRLESFKKNSGQFNSK